ncbi:TPA: type I DNA topoisomerase [Escherichia coli]|nr:type I DNA topoisomerase [Escherichia coli]
MATLVIVESPNKVAKISSILGDGYKVMASVGHVRDLPPKEIGISPPDYELTYQPTDRGKQVLAKLKAAAANADRVVLATDPDREGEAISWHLADALRLKNAERVTFTAITKEKILAAFQNPRPLDMNRVHAQEARRALDRMIGYRVSPVLSNRVGQQLGTGRVQSPAVRLVVDRERAITSFKETLHFGAELLFESHGVSWRAQWETKAHLAEGEKYILDSALAKSVASVRAVTVTDFEDTKKGRAPAAPFTTSTLQQAASQRLKLSPKATMELAQKLYEQGLITYHRTDAPNMDAEGMAEIAAYAHSAGLPLAEKPRRWKAKEGAQEGHEAIRPTHIEDLDAGADENQKALYRLIWQRAVASQLADAIYAVRTVRLSGEADGQPVTFAATGRTLTDKGWMAVYADDAADEDSEPDEAATNPVPELATGKQIEASDGRVLSKKTKPPVRYKQATLIAEMERLGIGRPSTYAAIMDNIIARSYIVQDNKGYLTPTKTGEILRDSLVERFAFVDLDYTRGLEEYLDQIAEGQNDYFSVVSGAWTALDDELAKLETAEIQVAHPCPECGKPLARRKGQYGFFWSCTGYPDCNVTLPDAKGEPGKKAEAAAPSGYKCPECNKDLVRRKGKKGFFWSCSGFPECRTALPDVKGKPGEKKAPPAPTGIKCPKCGKDLARRQGVSKPKKPAGGFIKGLGAVKVQGKPYDFYSCTGYPQCDATYPTGEDGNPILES